MIKSIAIENFRGFHKTRIEGFSTVNLIGGYNNVGKTSLLEAIFLGNSPSNSSVLQLKMYRREKSDGIKALPQRSWDYFFYQGNKENPIVISSTFMNGDFFRLKMTCDEVVDDLVQFFDKNNEEEEDFEKIKNSLSNPEIAKSVLHIDAQKNGEDYSSSVLIASESGLFGKGLNAPSPKSAKMIPSLGKLEGEALSAEYDKALLNNRGDFLTEAFRLFDASISTIQTLNIGQPVLYVKREKENFLPLYLFGDAMVRISDYVLRIVNNRNGVVLIDEIENGIHHTKQREVWKLLFKLANKFNVQLFATTHSREMTEAFVDVSKSDSAKHGAYFELVRSPRFNEVVANTFEVSTLDYALSHNEPFRGE